MIALGVFVLLASRIPGFGKPVRVFAIVAAVPRRWYLWRGSRARR